MEKNTQYLYEYKDGKRVRSIGFMKVEQQVDSCMLIIHAKQMDTITGIRFRKENGDLYIAGWSEEAPLPEVSPQEQAEAPRQETLQAEEIEEVDEYIPQSGYTYEKISRQDLSRLPRKEWRIANNSFLLHGFHNYHHLLYIKEDDNVWIGVPGIFHEKEEVAARAFGFPEFRRVTDVEIDLKEEEQNRLEDFGYWCRQISV